MRNLVQRQNAWEQSLCRVHENREDITFQLSAELSDTQRRNEALGDAIDACLKILVSSVPSQPLNVVAWVSSINSNSL